MTETSKYRKRAFAFAALSIMLSGLTPGAAEASSLLPQTDDTVLPAEFHVLHPVLPADDNQPTLSSPPVVPTGSSPVVLRGKFPTTTPVRVWGQVWVPAENRWSNTVAQSTDSVGRYAISSLYHRNVSGQQTWRVGAKDADGHISYTNTVTIERVAATVHTEARIGTGTTLKLSGEFPTDDPIRVWGQVWVPSRHAWSNTAAKTTTSSGAYTIESDYHSYLAGSNTWRVAARHSNGHIQYTPMVKVTRVKASISAPSLLPTKAALSITGRFPTDSAIRVWGQIWIPSQRRWSNTPVTTTNSNGSYTITSNYHSYASERQTWRVAARHTDGQIQYTQTTVVTRAAASVSAPANIPTGSPIRLTGKFPTSSPLRVWGQVWQPSQRRWSNTPVTTTNSNGSYTITSNYHSNVSERQTWRVAAEYPDGQISYTSNVTTRRISTRLDARCLNGRVLCVSKSDRRLYWVIDGKIITSMDARFGRRGMETREGTFRVYWKSRHHVSSIYHTSMPLAMFFSRGQAIHYSPDFARHGYNSPGSHGCINIRDRTKLTWLFNRVRTGDKVVVYR